VSANDKSKRERVYAACSIDLWIVDKRDLGVQVKVFSFSFQRINRATSHRSAILRGDKSEFAKVNNKGV